MLVSARGCVIECSRFADYRRNHRRDCKAAKDETTQDAEGELCFAIALLSRRCVAAIAERTLQPPLGDRRVHKEPDLLGIHKLLLGAKRWRVVTNNGDVADVALQHGIASKALAPGFVGLEI